AVVSAMYRLVMRWITDGSGGSGLSEEEFGSWAVKVNAAITFIEYTLTFLVSMSAMVTFIADRMPVLNEAVFGMQYRTIVAISLSVLTGWLVNRGPKAAARAFGPATAGVLILLWAMVIATIWKFGFHLPTFNMDAFLPENLGITLGGYVRILAVMTGIEVFANLVAAYDGDAAQKSSKAFKSLLIIMGTTAVTMLIVGPAIFRLSDPTNPDVSVFTQTMDQLLPAPLPWLGTLVGIAVLMSASAASAQGLQNLSLGLKQRRYIPEMLGRRNKFGVADKPVWIEVGIVTIAFILFGTHEETYLALYAAGVFILLSMTGWAVTKRLIREARQAFTASHAGLIAGTVIASLLTSIGTVIIFEERMAEGAWAYFVMIPLLYSFFSYSRKRLGTPSSEMEYLGRFNTYQLAGFGFGQSTAKAGNGDEDSEPLNISWQPDPIEHSNWREVRAPIQHIVVLLDGSEYAAQAIPTAVLVCKATNAKLTLLSSVKDYTPELLAAFEATKNTREQYLEKEVNELRGQGIPAHYLVLPGFIADACKKLVDGNTVDLVITSTRGKSGSPNWKSGGVSNKLVRKITRPVLLVPTENSPNGKVPNMEKILVPLDGSIRSEASLPFARTMAKAFNSELILLSVPAIPEAKHYGAVGDVVEHIRMKAEQRMHEFLEAVASSIREEGVEVRTLVTGTLPARTICSVSHEEKAGLIMITSRGRGGLDLLFLGSVAEEVVSGTKSPVFMIPIQENSREGI
ncbi:MAG: universal stress protein, partial [Chloroflexi bacterium]|nr:universal stress protein [Chloroflexota bacterium]